MKRSRGRPLKFGRPSRVVAVTLPQDVIESLQRIDADLGRAIVALAAAVDTPDPPNGRAIVEFEKFSRRRSLIVVDREALKGVPGCELIPLSQERAFLAMEEGRGLPDLELAIIDRLADTSVSGREREGLEELRRTLKECRRKRGIEVEPRSILVVEKSDRTR